MRQSRIYHPHPLTPNTSIVLTDSAANYLANVLRLKPGAELILFNGQGGEYSAEVTSVNKRKVEVTLHQYIEKNIESPLALHLGQGISRGERMDIVIQKATELGVTEITPLITERCNVKLTEERWQKRWLHWQGIAISACEQCGRTVLPVIHQPMPLSDWLAQADQPPGIVLDHRAQATLKDIKLESSALRLLIGPEGGLTEAEITIATQQAFNTVKLGPRVLRTETAAITALSLLQYGWGDI
tara:strand:+ start:30784 stop:31512 length:729 start_codon:yes stop_codon:yes gene_type:complete